MPFDLATAIPIDETETKPAQRKSTFDLESAKPIQPDQISPDVPPLAPYLKYKFRKGYLPITRGAYGREAMWGRMDTTEALNKGNIAYLEQLEAAGKLEDITFKDAPVKFVLGEAAELVPFMLGATKEGLKNAVTLGVGFGTITAAAGQLPPFTFLPEEAVTVPSAFASGIAVGFPYGIIKYSLDFEGGNMFLDMIEQGVSEDVARPLSLAGGTLIGIIETAQLNLLAAPFKQIFAKTLESKIAKNALAGVVRNYLKTAGGEIAEEELQEVVQLSTEALAGMIDKNPNVIPSREEWAQRLIAVAKKATPGMAVLALPGAAVDLVTYRQHIRQEIQAEPKEAEIPALGKPGEEIIPLEGVEVAEGAEMPLESELIEEAKKYKSAEEFVAAQPQTPQTEDIKPLLTNIWNKAQIERTETQITKEDISAKIQKLSSETKKSISNIQIKDFVDSNLQQEIAAMEEKENKRLTLAEKNKVEIKGIEATIEAIKDAPQYNEAGINLFENKAEVLTDLREQLNFQREQFKGLQAEMKTQKITTILKQKIDNIKRGFRAGKIQAQEEIETIQTELADLLERSGLEAKDKAKFIRTIKNIQTVQQFDRVFGDITNRIEKYLQSTEKNKLDEQIKKELKSTKPVKVGQKKIGKYDYESNKLFETLRGYNSLNQEQAQAELDAYPDEFNSESDLIKKRFLSLKANGKGASLDIFKKVSEDIAMMKEIGEQAKDEADFIKRLNRQEKVEEMLSEIKRVRGNKKTARTKIVNIYRRGFSNIYSMLNSICGKKLAEKYNPEINESNRNTALYFKTKGIIRDTAKIYDEKNVIRLLNNMAIKNYTITDIEGLTTEISKLEIIDIYNSIKNEKKQNDYYESYGEEQVTSLINNLLPEDIAFADYLQEVVQGYRDIFNQRNIEITGRDLGSIENYWPATSEHMIDVFDDIRMQGETPSAMKERAKGRVIPVPRNAWFKAHRHIAQAEHIDNLSREYETLKRLFMDRKVKNAITNKFGEDVYQVLMNQIDRISLNAQMGKLDAISNWFGNAINNWVSAQISVPNLNIFVRQLMPMGNYVEEMNAFKWTIGFLAGISNPKATFDFMWKNAPFLEERFHLGYSEAVREAMEGATKLNSVRRGLNNFLTSFVRIGDMISIVYGGYPLVKAEMAKGKSLTQAIETFEKATLRSQQSGLSSSRSEFQNSRNPFARLFLAFKNTSNQYFRKMVDAGISYRNKDISLEQYIKTMTIYAVIQPILYVSSGFATKHLIQAIGAWMRGEEPEDVEKLGEDLIDEIIVQLVVNPFDAFPIIDDIVTYTMRNITGQDPWKVFSTPLFDDLELGISKFGKKEITGDDWLTLMASILEPTTALPVKSIIRYRRYILGEKKKSSRPKIGR